MKISLIITKWNFWLFVAALVLMRAITLASTISVTTVSGYNPGADGGEFNVIPTTGMGYAPSVLVNGGFENFCLNRDIGMIVPGTYNATVNINGVYDLNFGTGTMSRGTAYLYQQFSIGALSGYRYGNTGGGASSLRATDARNLQLAIWTLESQYSYGSLTADLANPFVAIAANHYGSGTTGLQAAMAANSAGGFGVGAINLTFVAGNAANIPAGTKAQPLLVLLTDPLPYGWRQTIETQPIQPTYGSFASQAGKDSLVVVTHGWNPRAASATSPPDAPWVDDMASSINTYLENQGMNNWRVVPYKWLRNAWTFLPDIEKAKQEGLTVGKSIASLGLDHVHFIAHSLGAELIQTACEIIKSNSPATTVHCTFLDPYVGFDYKGISSYGNGANWSDNYFTKDIETGAELFPFTEGPLNHTYNVDVTQLDTHKEPIEGFFSTASGVSEPCHRTITSHGWPKDFYSDTIPPNSLVGSGGLGFALSKEGGNWAFAQSVLTRGNQIPVKLGPPDPSCIEYLYVTTPMFSEPAINFASKPQIPSLTGTIQQNSTGLKLMTDSPAWLATVVSYSNVVNCVSFDASFSSVAGAEGLLSVYWDANTIGTIDERTVQPGSQHYTFTFPKATSNSTHILGFRLDPFSATQSVGSVTNVTAGFYGVTLPFNLSVTTNIIGGQLIFELKGQSGFAYTVQASSNLIDWLPIAILINTNGTVRFVDQNAKDHGQRFYRAVAP